MRYEDRPKVLQKIIDKFGTEHVARVLAVVTNDKLGAIDDIGRAFAFKWVKEYGKDTKELKLQKREIQHSGLPKEEKKEKVDKINEQIKNIDDYNAKLNNPYSLSNVSKMKKLVKSNPEEFKEKYPEIEKYIDGITCAKLSLSKHAAGYCVSNINLFEEYGIMYNDGEIVSQLQMDEMHDVNLVKYDLLVLKSISVLQQICDYVGIKYPRSYEIDWNDMDVWDDLANDCIAIPQFEGNQASNMVATMKPRNVEELAIINAALRPAGASYRDDLCKRIQHHSPNPDVDEFLKSTYGVMPFQENLMQFLVRFCGMSGSESDSMRRLISSKNHEKINEAIPKIIDGYCAHRDLPRAQAEKEAEEYVQVIKDAGSYAFNKSHALGYSMIGYVFAYMKHYHSEEFITAFLNYAANEEDIQNGTKLAQLKNIKILEPVFGKARAEYSYDSEQHIIYKGIGSIKFLNNKIGEQLYKIGQTRYNNFFDVLKAINENTSVNSKQLDILTKLDFFKNYDNSKKILLYIDIFNNKLKCGGATYVNKSTINNDTLWSIITANTNNTPDVERVRLILNDGTNYYNKILDDITFLIQSTNIKDFSFKDKIAFQQEYLGYMNIRTNKNEDRPKLYVTKIQPLIAKKGKSAGKCWSRIIHTYSLGSGKQGEFWMLESTYQNGYHFQEGDIIYAPLQNLKQEEYNGSKQWWIKKYDMVIG